MIFDKDINKLIKELEAEMSTCNEEDQFGYAKIDAWDVYKGVIKRLKEINTTKFVEELEKERDNISLDKYGYVEDDVYKKIIKRLKRISVKN